MKTITVRLPEELAAEIEAESRATGVSKSDVVRRRLEGRGSGRARKTRTLYELASDLIGSIDDATIPDDLSSRKKHYLKERGYGERRHR